MWRSRFVLAAAIMMGPMAAKAETLPPCAPRHVILYKLHQDFRERPIAAGLVAGNGNVVELLLSGDGTWTLLVTGPSGVSCMIASGDNWEWRWPQPDEPGT